MPKRVRVTDDPDAVPMMRRGEYRKCLDTLRVSHRELASMLGCAEPLPGLWSLGRRTVPPVVAKWLRACLAVRATHPYPEPPQDWRRRSDAPPRQGIPGL